MNDRQIGASTGPDNRTLETRIEELERINAIMQRQIVDLTVWLKSHDKRFKAMSEAAFKMGRIG